MALAALAVASTAVSGAAGLGHADAATAATSHGMVADLTWYISRPEMDRSIALMRDAGVRWVRANMNWSSVEPAAKGSLDQWWLAEIDYAVTAARAAGIQVLMPIADGVPYWASADPQRFTDGAGNHWNRYWKPARFQDYADFTGAVVARYQALGVHAYEVWNEPNYVRFWPSGPSATDYAALLRAAAPAIRQADPAATVVLGGLSLNDATFLQQLYDAGAGASFDVAAVHPYTGGVDPTQCWYQPGTTRFAKEAFCGIEEVRRTMLANGDSRDLWLTEFGWSTSSAPGGVNEAVQADYLTKAFDRIATYPYVKNSFWYSLRNNYWQGNDPADLEADYGLTRVDFTQKPGYAAYKASAGQPAPVSTPTTTSTLTSPPTVSQVGVSNVGTTSATVSWTTNQPSTSIVRFWVSGSPVSVGSAVGLVTAHRVGLSGLQRRTKYNYQVESANGAGSSAASAVSSFTTSR